jgi:uracil-DNA glycosylase family 4
VSPDRRRRYLDRLGIDLWSPRVRASAAAAAVEATASAETASAWESLAAEVAGCRRCKLCETRTRTVFGVGDRSSRLMVIGEAPGADEDRRGEPFVGRAGKLLDQMLRAMGWPRERVYIANILKCRPPGNRDPQAVEVAACEPYLQRQLELVRPDLVLAVGRVAAQNLLKTDLPTGRLRGQIHRYGPFDTPLVVTYHPAYLLRSPKEKARAWQDLKLARGLLADAGGQRIP